MEIFNVVSGVCSIVGLAVSLFTVSKVVKISQNLNVKNRDDYSKMINKSSRNTYSGTVISLVGIMLAGISN